MTDNTEFKSRVVEKIKREFGDILRYLQDGETIELMLNSDGKLWVERLGKEMQCLGNFPETRAKSIITAVSSLLDTTANSDNPILECELPLDGSRFEALLPPVVAKPTFTIRKKAVKIFTTLPYKSLSFSIRILKTATKSSPNFKKDPKMPRAISRSCRLQTIFWPTKSMRSESLRLQLWIKAICLQIIWRLRIMKK